MLEPSPLADAARRYMDAPFAHQGRAPHGMDCAGLLVLAEADNGRLLRDIAAYGKRPWQDGLEAALRDNYGEPVLVAPFSPTLLLAGDKVLCRFRREPQHIAIVTDYYLGGPGLIHTRSDVKRGAESGRVTEHILDARWLGYIMKVFR